MYKIVKSNPQVQFHKSIILIFSFMFDASRVGMSLFTSLLIYYSRSNIKFIRTLINLINLRNKHYMEVFYSLHGDVNIIELLLYSTNL